MVKMLQNKKGKKLHYKGLAIMVMVLVVVFVALPPVSIGGRGAVLETRGVFDGPGGRCNIISISWT